MKTDETLWAEFQAGDQSALAELDRRWRDHLLAYVQQRQATADVVNQAFDRLASHRGPLDCVRWTLYCTVHVLTGADCDWRNGIVLMTPESGLPPGFIELGIPEDASAIAL